MPLRNFHGRVASGARAVVRLPVRQRSILAKGRHLGSSGGRVDGANLATTKVANVVVLLLLQLLDGAIEVWPIGASLWKWRCAGSSLEICNWLHWHLGHPVADVSHELWVLLYGVAV